MTMDKQIVVFDVKNENSLWNDYVHVEMMKGLAGEVFCHYCFL